MDDADAVAEDEVDTAAAACAAAFATAAAAAAEDGGEWEPLGVVVVVVFFDRSITTGGANDVRALGGRGPVGAMCVSFLVVEINGRVRVKLLWAVSAVVDVEMERVGSGWFVVETGRVYRSSMSEWVWIMC